MHVSTDHPSPPTPPEHSPVLQRNPRRERRDEMVHRLRRIVSLAEELARESNSLHQRCQLLRLITAADDVLLTLVNQPDGGAK